MIRRHIGIGLVACVFLLAGQAFAHDIGYQYPLVIDTDMGIDDAAALSLALQSKYISISTIVATEGAAGREACVRHLERMLDVFNRGDVRLYSPANVETPPAPPFRSFAERAVGGALPASAPSIVRTFEPGAYTCKGDKTVVLALGPLTNIAAALKADPAVAGRMEKIVVAGGVDGWNVRFDEDALKAVRAAGVALEFIIPTDVARKPQSWSDGEIAIGAGTSVGESFFRRLLTPPTVREHYLTRFEEFHDELAVVYLLDETLFKGDGNGHLTAIDREKVSAAFIHCLSKGRQGKKRVVFAAGELPNEVLRPDVRRRKAGIIAKNGDAEWFAQLLMNELHEHLGAYSVIGVKMGLRAAELLNAPQHGLHVVSHVPPRPPVSCLNDGVIVATGSTPGRALFAHRPEATSEVAVSFEYNGRRIRLTVKAEYRDRIRAKIRGLLEQYTLEDDEYWHGVREFGLEIWENWHRRDLFDVIEEAR